ncbi:MAG: hypothetical protein ABIH82_01825 [Candidatus Woesearchaeota archaeon]
MDGKDIKRDKEYLEDFKRARSFYQKALLMLDSDLETTANRTYLSFENASCSFLKWKESQVSKKHAQIWEKMSKAYLQGLLSFDPKFFLEKSYEFHLYVDYGKKEFKGEDISFNKEELKKLLGALKKLLEEVEKIVK